MIEAMKDFIAQKMFVFSKLPIYPQLIVKYGLWLSVFYIGYIYLMSLTPLQNIPYIGYSQFILIVVSLWLLVLLLKHTKKLDKKYFDQVVTGTMYFAIAGGLIALSLYPLTEWFKPGMLEQERSSIVEFIRTNTENPDDAEKRIKIAESIYKQPRFSLEQFTSFTSMGLVYSAVVAIFLRYKKPKDTFTEITTA